MNNGLGKKGGQEGGRFHEPKSCLTLITSECRFKGTLVEMPNRFSN